MKKKQKTIHIMQGCQIARTSTGDMLFGCISEIIKVLARMKLEVPSIIILPNYFFRYGVVQAALEFPLYFFLFVKQGFSKGEKLTIVGTKNQLKRMKTILRLTLLGPNKDEMVQWRIPAVVKKMYGRIGNKFALPSKQINGTAPIEELVEFVEFIGNKTNVNGVSIEIVKRNVFKITDGDGESHIDINIAGSQNPPIPIEAPDSLADRSTFGVTSISKCTTGFDSSGYTSGLILWLNSMGVSVDGVAWMKEHLKLYGIGPEEVRGHILTHIHDDHSNIFDLIVNGKKATIITAKVIFKSFLLKTALLLDIPVSKLRRMVNFIEVVPGKKINLFGADFDFWYTVHTIPTIGFRVTVGGKSIVYSGDTLWGSKLDSFMEEITAEASNDELDILETVKRIPELASEITFFDAGGDPIHPLAKELSLLPGQMRKGMVLTHTGSLPEELEGKFSLVRAGKSWEIIPSPVLSVSDSMAITESPIFQGIGEEWLRVIIIQGKIRKYEAERILLEEGYPGKNLSLILGGAVSVLYGKKEVAILSTGDFFGEISIIKNQNCTATIKTKSAVKILELPREIFLQIVNSTNLGGRLSRLHQIRPVLIEFAFFKNLPSRVMSKLTDAAQIKGWKAGDTIIKQGGKGDFFYGIIEGRANVIVKNNGSKKRIATLYKKQVFGEIALLSGETRTASVIAETNVEVFTISKKAFNEIVGKTPGLAYYLGIMAEERKEEL